MHTYTERSLQLQKYFCPIVNEGKRSIMHCIRSWDFYADPSSYLQNIPELLYFFLVCPKKELDELLVLRKEEWYQIDQGGHFNLEPFRTFGGPLFHKSVGYSRYHLRIFQQQTHQTVISSIFHFWLVSMLISIVDRYFFGVHGIKNALRFVEEWNYIKIYNFSFQYSPYQESN